MMKSCNCENRKEMLENSLSMYEDALSALEKEFLEVDEKKILSSPNVRHKWEEKADLMGFYEREIYKLEKELKVYTC